MTSSSEGRALRLLLSLDLLLLVQFYLIYGETSDSPQAFKLDLEYNLTGTAEQGRPEGHVPPPPPILLQL